MWKKRVESIGDAIALAREFQMTYQYDWFRGQRHNWPLRSSLSRLSDIDQKDVLARLDRFFSWAHTTPGLESITRHVDNLLAVAQHYGLPTNFIDFTTDVSIAAFFATHGAAEGDECCIKCLNTKYLEAYWQSTWIAKSNKPTECLRLQVPNLWRLVAQRGTFLYCPYDEFERFYDGIFTILFPYSEPPEAPKSAEVYPERRSGLEILLDQYFAKENYIAFSNLMRKTVPSKCLVFMDSPVPANSHQPECPYFSAEFFIKRRCPPQHESWNAAALSPWRQLKEEPLKYVSEDIVWDFSIDWLADPNIVGMNARAYVATYLKANPGARGHLVRCRFHATGNVPDNAPINGELKKIEHYWDGVRLFPYSNEEVAEGIGNCIALQLWFDRLRGRYSPDGDLGLTYKVANSSFGDSHDWRLISVNGTETVAFVSTRDLAKCVRSDIGRFLSPEYADLNPFNENWDGLKITMLFQALYAPSHLFEFRSFAGVFARQLLPYQVAFRSVVIFSPAQLERFELP